MQFLLVSLICQTVKKDFATVISICMKRFTVSTFKETYYVIKYFSDQWRTLEFGVGKSITLTIYLPRFQQDWKERNLENEFSAVGKWKSLEMSRLFQSFGQTENKKKIRSWTFFCETVSGSLFCFFIKTPHAIFFLLIFLSLHFYRINIR